VFLHYETSVPVDSSVNKAFIQIFNCLDGTHTTLYDSAHASNFFVAATHRIKQCALARQPNSSVTEVTSEHKA
jgi:hypothetical protein